MLKLLPSLIFTLVVVFVVSFILGYQTEIAHSPSGWDGALLMSSVATIIAAIALVFYVIGSDIKVRFTCSEIEYST